MTDKWLGARVECNTDNFPPESSQEQYGCTFLTHHATLVPFSVIQGPTAVIFFFNSQV